MSYRVIFHPIAKTEYNKAYHWYENQLPGLGDRFEWAVESRIDLICAKPLLFPKKRGAFHEVKVSSFPYLIVYKIYEAEKTVFISAVHQTRRNPKRKYRK